MFKNSFRSSRSSIWNKDLLLHVNPYFRHKRMYNQNGHASRGMVGCMIIFLDCLNAISKNNLKDKQRRKNEESLSLMALCLFSICGDISIF